MIISKTPFRVSLFGGSTDYPSYYKKNGSLILGFAIDKYCYLNLRKTPRIFNYKTAVSYSKLEKVSKNSSIEHNGVRGALEYFNIKYGVEIHHLCDLPSQTGIGSSSSFIVGLVNAICEMKNQPFSQQHLAQTAIEIERNRLKEPGGIQDQIWAAYGGLNSIDIATNGSFEVKPLPVSEQFKESFLDRCVLFYTGSKRKSFQIAKSHDSTKTKSAKRKIHSIARKAYEAFQKADIDQIAALLHQGWTEKKKISPLISSPEIESLYEGLQDQGMIGGKLLGTGGSGFILCILKEGMKKQFVSRNSKSVVDFTFDDEGSQIINQGPIRCIKDSGTFP